MTTPVVATRQQVFSRIDSEIVILDVAHGHYFGLDGVGVLLWEALQHPRTPVDLCQTVVARYKVDRDRCEQDVLALLHELRRKGLIEVAAAGSCLAV
jgi:Coenzyme PQQ synthesis protein D (PqqD)